MGIDIPQLCAVDSGKDTGAEFCMKTDGSAAPQIVGTGVSFIKDDGDLLMRHAQGLGFNHQIGVMFGRTFVVIGVGNTHDRGVFSGKAFGGFVVEKELPARHTGAAADLRIDTVNCRPDG